MNVTVTISGVGFPTANPVNTSDPDTTREKLRIVWAETGTESSRIAAIRCRNWPIVLVVPSLIRTNVSLKINTARGSTYPEAQIM